MAKRGADKQLGKDDAPSDEEVEDPGVRSEALRPVAGRQIRSLPKRKGLGGPGPSTVPVPPAATGFSGFGAATNPTTSTTTFSGFGASSSSSGATSNSAPAAPPAAFSFATPVAASVATAPATAPSTNSFSGFTFGKPSSTAAPSSSIAVPAAEPPRATTSDPTPKPVFAGFSFGKPSSAPVATPAAPPAPAPTAAPVSTAPVPPKPVFAGFTFAKPSSTSSDVPAAQPAVASSSGPAPSQSTPPNEGEVKYYTALRGLNSSFLLFLSKQLNSNEFLDLSNVLPTLLSQYEKHLGEAEQAAGWKPKLSKEADGAGGSVANAITAPKAPTAANGEFSFGKQPTVPIPSAVATPLGVEKPIGGTSSKKSSDTVTKMVTDVFDAESATQESQPQPERENDTASVIQKQTGSLFSFAPSGPLHPATPGAKSFAPSASTTSPAEQPPKLGKFGPGGSAPTLSFGGAKSTAPSTSPSKGFSFGNSSSGTTSFNFGASSSSPAESSTKTAAPFAFGAPTATLPKPSAFSFGASTPSESSSAQPFSFGMAPATSSGGFSFGKPATTSALPASGVASEATSGAATPAAGAETEGATDEQSANLAEGAGEGEEDEDTVVEQRAKLYELKDGSYSVVGLGVFKLKRNKDNGKRRLLMRQDRNGNILLNCSVLSSFDPKVDGPSVKFLGFDLEGKPKPYTLRVKNKEVAEGLNEKMVAEVAEIKKSEA